MIDHYDWPGGREAMLRFGPAGGPVVIAALPLFEEANRTRAFVVTILRQLATRGIASALPDLPASGESSIATEQAQFLHWGQAFAAATSALRTTYDSAHVVALRGGALLDQLAKVESRWHLAPQSGESVVRELARVAAASAKEAGESLTPAALTQPGPPVEIAGNSLSPALLSALAAAQPCTSGAVRTIRLESDPRTADRHVPGSPLWRRSEPDNDPALAALLADDIAAWIASCVA